MWQVRHLWGEPQYELHPGAQELFLDLIFVGVAYRIGSVLMVGFYACIPPEGSAYYTTNASAAAGASAGRALAAIDGYDDELYECIGLPLGLLQWKRCWGVLGKKAMAQGEFRKRCQSYTPLWPTLSLIHI